MSDSLHSRLLARIDELEAAWHLAAAAGDPDELDAALYDDVLLGEAARAVVELHAPRRAGPHVQCDYCDGLCHSRSGLGCDQPADALYPCDTIRAVAAALGVELDDQ